MKISPKELADTLDTMVSQLEAGRNFDQAILRVSEDQSHELAPEFAQMLGEIQAGSRRREAIQQMAERVKSPEFTLFVKAVINADETGKSILEVVRAHAQQLRAE